MTVTEQGKGAVIVTGASRGIGAAIAVKLAGDGYGVLVNYARDADGAGSVVSAIKAGGGRAVAVRADVTAPDEVATMFQRARDELGPLTALVNNAGMLGEGARVDERDADELTQLMRVNVVGPMVCAKHAVRAMSTARGGAGGSIVNVASVAARTGGLPGLVPYATTKGALLTFTRGLANEVGAEGIRVNSVSPGIIATDMAAAIPGAEDAAGRTPLGRMGRSEEVAATVSWLISPAASYVTGSDITVSGGR
ncbi:SDR family NAD(P)-dependent oxidoreductase [Planosporangium mesophilum]|uniref:Glucose-1-dehydrogenase n=1 Tax=Planosporangium mesophilum TaxID=689768 RepID=A0A8J3X3H9_9ACTN|nr:SDR family oxidoreductase [Planosporangium mesophilum]NJC84119.1 SDR family oxidoreductase [Planosporangium mesophilum]GII22878.1 glucose-1-dehydrogenase [Planosporangium mesophilum]